MFTHIRKHQKWLWIVISAGVIISFVWYFNPNQQSGMGGGGARAAVGEMYGEPVTQAQYGDAYREAVLHYRLNYGEWPVDNEASRQLRIVENETRNRLLLARAVKDYNIEVSDKATADWMERIFTDPETKAFRREYYDNFMQNIRQARLEPRDFERYARHAVAIQHLAATAALPGKLVTPQEAESTFREENVKADTIVAFVATTNFLPQIQVSDVDLSTFFTNRAATYREPEKVALSYVTFPASNYFAQADAQLAGITNLSQQIDALYTQRGANFYTDTNGQVMTPEAAKTRIREELRLEGAKVKAQEAAINFASALIEQPVITNALNPAEALERLAATNNLKVEVTEPFSRNDGPRNLVLPDPVIQAAFSLSPAEPYLTEPVVGEEAVYVMALNRSVKSEIPEFATIRDRVLNDYKRNQAQTMAREAASKFLNAFTNKSDMTNFAQSAVTAGLTVMNLPPVPKTGRMSPELENRPEAGSIRNTAFTLKEGDISSFMPTRDGGYILYVEKIIPASDEEVKQELPAFLAELRTRRAGDAFQDWFSREMQKANLRLANDEPEDQAQQPM